MSRAPGAAGEVREMAEAAELDPRARAKIASMAQASAHKQLRARHPEEYREAYQQAKDALTRRAEARLRKT